MSTKVNKEALYFRQAAVMLGEAEAERHLQIVIDDLPFDHNWPFDDRYCDLCHLFPWVASQQGHDFWNLVEFVANEEGIAE